METNTKETSLQTKTRRFDTDAWYLTREHKKRLNLEKPIEKSKTKEVS